LILIEAIKVFYTEETAECEKYSGDIRATTGDMKINNSDISTADIVRIVCRGFTFHADYFLFTGRILLIEFH